MRTLALLWQLLTGDPGEAVEAAAVLAGHPELAEFLGVVALLEGNGGNPGLHPGDAGLGPLAMALLAVRRAGEPLPRPVRAQERDHEEQAEAHEQREVGQVPRAVGARGRRRRGWSAWPAHPSPCSMLSPTAVTSSALGSPLG